MIDRNENVVRNTSFSAWLLTIIGSLLVLAGLVSLFSFPGGGAEGLSALVGGVVLLGIGSIRNGLLDIVYELRMNRAAIRDLTSNHTADGDVDRQ